jgi:hypothetical protein
MYLFVIAISSFTPALFTVDTYFLYAQNVAFTFALCISFLKINSFVFHMMHNTTPSFHKL